jgi:TPP-dependent pyruvate/acetoin dehydrogenase alpha subunit
MEDEIERALDEAVEFAVNSPFPELRELQLDVYETEMVS